MNDNTRSSNLTPTISALIRAPFMCAVKSDLQHMCDLWKCNFSLNSHNRNQTTFYFTTASH